MISDGLKREYPTWTIKKKLAQLVFPRLDGKKWLEDREYYLKMCDAGVGGFCIFNATLALCSEICDELVRRCEIPPLLSCDMEHGIRMRFPDGTSFPRAGAIGSTNNPGNAYLEAKIVSIEAKSCGIYWNFSPVADVDSNPDNPIINFRAYSDDQYKCAEFVNAYIDGAQEERVIACVKHFPGHGDTSVDSHVKVPVLNASIQELSLKELVPFYSAIKKGVRSVMVGHLAVPSLDPTATPASLSRPIVTSLLREKIGFGGLIVSDALDMKALNEIVDDKGSVFAALNAGIDVALMPEDPIADIEKACMNIEKLDSEQIQDSFDRLIENKRWCGILDGALNSRPKPDFNENEKIALRIAKDSLALYSEIDDYKIEEDDKFALLCVLSDDSVLDKAMNFATMLHAKTINDCDTAYVNSDISDEDFKAIAEPCAEDNLAIIALFQSPGAYRERKGFGESLIDRINAFVKFKKSILVVFGNPNLKDGFKYDMVVDAISDTDVSMRAAAILLSDKDDDFDFTGDSSILNRVNN
jgi:beta-glucosidase-like glycosyl hydrolase